jgi:hypothetical protein
MERRALAAEENLPGAEKERRHDGGDVNLYGERRVEEGLQRHFGYLKE